jgi:hypothetical protein
LKGAQLKSQFDLHAAVLEDQMRLLGIDASSDLATLRSQVEHKGEAFLTLILPTLGQYLEQGLEEGQLPSKGHLSFGKRSRSDMRPAFLHGAWSEVFDPEGILLSHPSPEAVRAIRQIAYLHGKLKELPSPERSTELFVLISRLIKPYPMCILLKNSFLSFGRCHFVYGGPASTGWKITFVRTSFCPHLGMDPVRSLKNLPAMVSGRQRSGPSV